MDFINLGFTDKHTFSHEIPSDEKEDKVSYPCLYIYDAPKGLLGIPKEGEAKIRYRVKSKTERYEEDGDEDDHNNAIDIEIRGFKPLSEGDDKFEVPEIDDNEILISIERTKKKGRK